MPELRLSKSDYDFHTLTRMAHRLCHFFSIEIATDGNDLVLTWEISEDLANDSIDRIRNEIYDQIIREKIHEDTKPIRDLIFAAAFSNLEIK
ncbi:hypothetical protein OAI75_01755 [Woeseiaceae bacterium]|nr:hypothetical protein [Woeseiaceae bacterium]